MLEKLKTNIFLLLYVQEQNDLTYTQAVDIFDHNLVQSVVFIYSIKLAFRGTA